jgi:hypothetical protein
MTMENYLQDLSEACAYAHECAPDLSALTLPAPFAALASISAVCFIIWAWNERSIRKIAAKSSAQTNAAATSPSLDTVIVKMKGDAPADRKMAA